MSLPSSAAGRFHLLLAVLAWLVPRRVARIAEIAAQFSLEEEDVVRIVELAACCGVPPYTADALLDLFVDGDRVEANLGNLLDRPRRLTAPEGFALATSARAILTVPGSDPDGHLARALAKLESALGAHVGLAVTLDESEFLEPLRSAVEARRQVTIEYFAASRDEVTTRTIEPFELFSVDGRWYVDAFCHRAGAARHFRLDRIRSLQPTDQPITKVEPSVGIDAHAAPFFEEVPEVTIEVPVSARRSLEGLPLRSLTPAGEGRLRAVLPVASTIWLERLMLVAGPGAEVVDPPELSGAGARAARRLRALYD